MTISTGWLYAIIIIGCVLAVWGAAFVYMCTHAPTWDQEEEAVPGRFYVKPLGGDHE